MQYTSLTHVHVDRAAQLVALYILGASEKSITQAPMLLATNDAPVETMNWGGRKMPRTRPEVSVVDNPHKIT